MTPNGRRFMPSTDGIRASLIGARKKPHMGHEQLARRSGLSVQAIGARALGHLLARFLELTAGK